MCIRINNGFTKSTLGWAKYCFRHRFFNMKTITRRRCGNIRFFRLNFIGFLLWRRVINMWSCVQVNHFSRHHSKFISGWRRLMQGLMISQLLLGWERVFENCWVGDFFRNLLISSRRGHSLVKWSPPQIKQGYFTFLFPLESASRVCGLLLSCWLSSFFNLFFPFFFLLKTQWIELRWLQQKEQERI